MSVVFRSVDLWSYSFGQIVALWGVCLQHQATGEWRWHNIVWLVIYSLFAAGELAYLLAHDNETPLSAPRLKSPIVQGQAWLMSWPRPNYEGASIYFCMFLEWVPNFNVRWSHQNTLLISSQKFMKWLLPPKTPVCYFLIYFLGVERGTTTSIYLQIRLKRY